MDHHELLAILVDVREFGFVYKNLGRETEKASVFEDQQGAEESNRRAEEWVSENLSDLLPSPNFAAGDVVVYAAR
jgi:hypothetical protein